MWYFAWILGTGFAVCFGIINAMWYDIKANEACEGNCQNNCHGKK